jgi:hypothetical protein
MLQPSRSFGGGRGDCLDQLLCQSSLEQIYESKQNNTLHDEYVAKIRQAGTVTSARSSARIKLRLNFQTKNLCGRLNILFKDLRRKLKALTGPPLGDNSQSQNKPRNLCLGLKSVHNHPKVLVN